MSKARHYRRHLVEVGLVNVEEHILPIPIGPWAKGRLAKEMGVLAAAALSAATESYRNLIITTGLPAEETDDLISQVKQDLRRRDRHWYMPTWVLTTFTGLKCLALLTLFYRRFVYGKKPPKVN
jgi:hypothetical protein